MLNGRLCRPQSQSGCFREETVSFVPTLSHLVCNLVTVLTELVHLFRFLYYDKLFSLMVNYVSIPNPVSSSETVHKSVKNLLYFVCLV
jgi:hypothetical protein